MASKTGYTVVEEILSTSKIIDNLRKVAAKSPPEEALLLGAAAGKITALEEQVDALEKELSGRSKSIQ